MAVVLSWTRMTSRVATARSSLRLLSAMAAPEIQHDRIGKHIALCGFASRREAESMIRNGRISMDGIVVESLGTRVRPGAVIKMDDHHVIRPLRRTRLFLYHKSDDEIVSNMSPKPQLKTVFERIEKSPDYRRLHLPRVVAVGRLDVTTEGLLLLTSSPPLATYLSHPDSNFERVYRARVFGEIDHDKLAYLGTGGVLRGVRYRPIQVKVERERHRNSWLQVTLSEGKNREIRKVLQWAGLAVNRLIRIRFGPFRLDELARQRVREIPIPGDILARIKH